MVSLKYFYQFYREKKTVYHIMRIRNRKSQETA